MLGLGQMICFIPAEGTIVVCFEVFLIKVYCLGVISNSCVEVALLAICETTVVVKIGFSRFDADSCREAVNSLVEVASSVKRDSLVVVGVGVFRVNLNRCRVILNGQRELA